MFVTTLKMEEKIRVAIVQPEKCKPSQCAQECKKYCPVVRMGKLCVVVSKKSKTAEISEVLCNGCNICVKKCPFGAISIINLPSQLTKNLMHRYGANTFILHRLPMPRMNQVLGLIGTNGIGKTTALKIMANKIKPNFGRIDNPPEWNEILTYFRGSELQNYFTKLIENTLRVRIKPQYVDALQRVYKKSQPIKELLDQKNEVDTETFNYIIDQLDLRLLYEDGRDILVLSGGELQRFAIAVICIQKADVYIFDEPSSFLDIKQRMKVASVIRSLASDDRYVICVEHDLALLDYLSDFVCCLYGQPGAYGVVTAPYSVGDGINAFLSGYIPTENMRFRNEELSFKISTIEEEIKYDKANTIFYPEETKERGSFKLKIESGSFKQNEIIVLVGQNGCGKTSFIKNISKSGLCKFISTKPQKIIPKSRGSVREVLNSKLGNSYLHSQFRSDVFGPLKIEELLDLQIDQLSGGELQRVAIVLCLGKSADLYLLDEPSAYLDVEQRIIVSKIIKRFIMHSHKCCFIVEHDFTMATYLADRVIYFDGQPSVSCVAHSPESLQSGMNKFLKQIDITFRRDPENWRLRVNKKDSVKDKEQKQTGNYF